MGGGEGETHLVSPSQINPCFRNVGTYKLVYISLQSLDDSVSTGTFSPPASNGDHTHREAESLRAELVGKDEEIAGLKEEVCRRESQEDQLREEMATLKDKLNVSEVRVGGREGRGRGGRRKGREGGGKGSEGGDGE